MSQAQIMIFCNREVDAVRWFTHTQKNKDDLVLIYLSVSQGSLQVIQENSERENHCLYLFRLDSSAVCPAVQSKLSTGSIILIMCVNTIT